MSKKSTNPVAKIFAFLGGYHVAIVCMVMLLLLTFFGTYEQMEPGGLYWMLRKYFSHEVFLVRPTYHGKDVPFVLPGGYWVCAVFTLNLFVGGVLRIRKGWKHAPVLVSHFSMVMLMVGGAVSHHESREAYLELNVGETGDAAYGFTELSIEISELVEGQRTEPTVIDSELILGIRGNVDQSRQVLLPDLPFDVEVSRYHIHANLYPVQGRPPEDADVLDGYFASVTEPGKNEELNTPSCILKITHRETKETKHLLLYKPIPHDITATIDGKVYGFRLRGEIWPLPFDVRLDKSIGEKHPGTGVPMRYESDVAILDEGGAVAAKAKIEMNKPLRHKGFTIYQTKWADDGETVTSTFTVKTNPSDQWPKIAIYVSGIALFVHFIIKLFGFVNSSLARNKNEQK